MLSFYFSQDKLTQALPGLKGGGGVTLTWSLQWHLQEKTGQPGKFGLKREEPVYVRRDPGSNVRYGFTREGN